MTIKQRQCLLYYLGYYTDEIDGVWGALSELALQTFLKDFGIPFSSLSEESINRALTHAVCYWASARS